MKICPICSTANSPALNRCSVCGTILPDTDVNIEAAKNPVKICPQCNFKNSIEMLRCKKCDAFLNSVSYISEGEEFPPMKLVLKSGSELLIEGKTILGRQYQDFWDAYTPRSFALIDMNANNKAVIKLIGKGNAEKEIRFNYFYSVGRLKYKFKMR